jgi:hypothetical protein
MNSTKDNSYCIYSQGEFILKKYLPWGTQTDTQERFYFPCNKLVRKDIDVNEHDRLSNITLGHKLR